MANFRKRRDSDSEHRRAQDGTADESDACAAREILHAARAAVRSEA